MLQSFVLLIRVGRKKAKMTRRTVLSSEPLKNMSERSPSLHRHSECSTEDGEGVPACTQLSTTLVHSNKRAEDGG